MPVFQINDDEREALRGLPMLSREIYVFGLRPFMDYSTGIVGARRGVSWKSIAEELYVEPHQGIKGGEPTEKELRRALAWLQKVELLSENMAERRLIFELLKASRDKSARNKVGSKWADEVGSYVAPPQPNNYAGLPKEEGREVVGGELPKVGTPPESGKSIPPPPRAHDFDTRTKFAMHPAWEPDAGTFQATLTMNGLAGMSASQDQLNEFRSFWTASPDEHRTQARWEHALAQHLKREHRNAQSNGQPGTSQAEADQNRRPGQQATRQRPLSAPDRVRAAIEEQRAAAARTCEATRLDPDAEAMDHDGGNLRAPLDVEFWRVTES